MKEQGFDMIQKIMKTAQKTKNPLILRYHRLMDAFAKSDDERDFYLDHIEGAILYLDLEKTQEELDRAEKEILDNKPRYFLIPKLTFYEIKKIMEGFVNEKVYDIDTKEKLLDIIQAKDAREHFLEFIYDNLSELEKWQQYYQERFRVRIIEWLRQNEFHFVFEEDLELGKHLVEKVKEAQFQQKVARDVVQARSQLEHKAKTYYSNEALNPRPKRGRPPKQAPKVSIEPEFSRDLYNQMPQGLRPFLYIPDITSAASVTFSSRFETEEQFLANLRSSGVRTEMNTKFAALSKRLDSLKTLSDRLVSLKNEGLLKGVTKEEVAVQKGKDFKKVKGIVRGVLPKDQQEGIKDVPDDGLFTPKSIRRRKK
jgi:hypothetical protein